MAAARQVLERSTMMLLTSSKVSKTLMINQDISYSDSVILKEIAISKVFRLYDIFISFYNFQVLNSQLIVSHEQYKY